MARSRKCKWVTAPPGCRCDLEIQDGLGGERGWRRVVRDAEYTLPRRARPVHIGLSPELSTSARRALSVHHVCLPVPLALLTHPSPTLGIEYDCYERGSQRAVDPLLLASSATRVVPLIPPHSTLAPTAVQPRLGLEDADRYGRGGRTEIPLVLARPSRRHPRRRLVYAASPHYRIATSPRGYLADTSRAVSSRAARLEAVVGTRRGWGWDERDRDKSDGGGGVPRAWDGQIREASEVPRVPSEEAYPRFRWCVDAWRFKPSVSFARRRPALERLEHDTVDSICVAAKLPIVLPRPWIPGLEIKTVPSICTDATAAVAAVLALVTVPRSLTVESSSRCLPSDVVLAFALSSCLPVVLAASCSASDVAIVRRRAFSSVPRVVLCVMLRVVLRVMLVIVPRAWHRARHRPAVALRLCARRARCRPALARRRSVAVLPDLSERHEDESYLSLRDALQARAMRSRCDHLHLKADGLQIPQTCSSFLFSIPNPEDLETGTLDTMPALSDALRCGASTRVDAHAGKTPPRRSHCPDRPPH
ncbi:hypothetical protein C8R45DRAFT_1102812 [Mycena sanguinolenta]|nr:hypothetical protein C8R45DRAFT_1102812 [Mycena sanguinolenta]